MTDGRNDEYYRQERREVGAVVPAHAERILDVGCGEGLLGRRLLLNGAREVTGIELSPGVCDRAEENLTHVICGDIENLDLEFKKEYFDCIIFADVLEHLKDPLAVIKKCREVLSDSGCIVASIPNVGYYGVINMLAHGRWIYEEHGILDKTHLRFFTRKEIEVLLRSAGFEITGLSLNMNPEYEHLDDPYSGKTSFGRAELTGLTPEEIRDLYVIQYIIQAKKNGHDEKHVKKDMQEVKKIAIVRGASLNKWEMQNYEPMRESFEMTAYTTNQTYFDISRITLPVVQLPFKQQGLLMEMEGLEESLADKDLVFTADITYKFSAQAVHAKQGSGCKVVCLEWENIPFNYEEYEEVHQIKDTVRNGADHFIAVTERAKEALMIEGVAEEKIDVIPMGVDLNVFRPVEENLESERKKMGIDRDDLVVLFIGRMVWEKGIYDFLHAASRICSDSSLNEKRIRFLIVGRGPELEGARERAEAVGISGSTIFIEEYPYEEMYKLHNISDMFVLPSISTRSWQEQFGMVLIESMACGTPVISTYSGSIPEVVGDGGMLVQPNDHLSLYRAMKEMIIDNAVRDDLGKLALKRAETIFDAKKTAEKVRDVFNNVLSRKTEADMIKETHVKSIACWEQGERDRAFGMVCEAFGIDQDNKNVLDSVIKMGMELEQFDTVEKLIKEFLQCHPANLDALTSLSEALFNNGKSEQAETVLKKVLIFDPMNRRAHVLIDRIAAKKNPVKHMS